MYGMWYNRGVSREIPFGVGDAGRLERGAITLFATPPHGQSDGANGLIEQCLIRDWLPRGYVVRYLSARPIRSLLDWASRLGADASRLKVSEVCGASGLETRLLHGVDIAIYDTICAVAGIINDRNARLVQPALEPFIAFARAFPDVAHVWVHRTIKHLRYAPPYEIRDVGGTVRFRIVPDAIYLGCPDRWHGGSWRVHIIPTDGRPSQHAFIVGEV
jgi:hypothetical protein